MITRLVSGLAMGTAGLAVAGALVAGVAIGAAGAALACAAGGKIRAPGARWPQEPQASPSPGVTRSEDAA